MNISSFVCDCIKISSKFVIAIFLSMTGRKNLLMNAKNDAGPLDGNFIENSVDFQ